MYSYICKRGGAGICHTLHRRSIIYASHVLHLRMMMTSLPRFRVFLVLLTILATEGCYGQSGSYSPNMGQLVVLYCSSYFPQVTVRTGTVHTLRHSSVVLEVS